MSWWTYERDKTGKVYYVSTDISSFYFLFLIFGGLLFAQFFINPTGTVRVLLWSGFLCVLMAKISLFRRGIWVSWGSGPMTVWWSRVYKLGYILISIGVALILVAHGATP